MIRSVLGKVMWVGRATVFLVGLAVILALVFGVASTAFAHGGYRGLFHLGHNNPIAKVTTLVGNVATGSALVVNNPSGGSALGLEVNAGKAPLTVNADAGKATNLDADKLDGKNSSEFMPSKIYAVQRTVTLGAHTIASRVVSCDEGDLATGGGYSELGSSTKMDKFHRYFDNDSARNWQFGFRTDTTEDMLTLQVVCADLPPLRP